MPIPRINLRSRISIFAASAMILLLSFQNCGGGFKTPLPLSSVATANTDLNPVDPSDLQTGNSLYEIHCASCHGPLETSTKRGRSAAAISGALANVSQMSRIFLTADQVKLIEQALAVTPPPVSTAWANAPFAVQTGKFTAAFTAVPSASQINAAIGFSNGASNSYANLATLIRFSPVGFIDVRSGSAYAALAEVAYTGNQSFNFRMEVDVTAHTYSVWVTPAGKSEVQLANGFAFRVEQATVSQLNNRNISSETGSIAVSGFVISTITSPPPAPVTGANLYKQNCASCHGALETSSKRNRTAAQITSAIATYQQMKNLAGLTSAEIQMIADALKVDTTTPPQPPQACEPTVSKTRIVRLTHEQYDNVVRELFVFSAATKYSENFQFAPDLDTTGFTNQADDLKVSDIDIVRKYRNAAKKIAADVMAAPATRLAGKWPCAFTLTDYAKKSTCVTQFFSNLGGSAYRRPLAPSELGTLLKIYDAAVLATGNAGKGLQYAVEFMLQSPSFLYRTELGAQAEDSLAVKQLTPYEIASFLSFTLWNSLPDSALLAKAADGSLSQNAVIASEVSRMLSLAKSRRFYSNFVMDWLDIDGVRNYQPPAELKASNPTLAQRLPVSMESEVRSFVDDNFTQGGSLEGLFTANYSFIDATLANVYGVTGSFGTGFTKVALPPERAGILTSAAVLGMYSEQMRAPGSIARGYLVRTKLLCQPIPPTPQGVDQTIPSAMPGESERVRLHGLLTTTPCLTCHTMMNPIGYGFLNFNSFGGFSLKEPSGVLVDNSGEVTQAIDANGSFHGAAELARKLATSTDLQNCVSKKVFQYTQGRADSTVDQCAVNSAREAFKSGGAKTSDLIKSFLQGEIFKTRAKE